MKDHKMMKGLSGTPRLETERLFLREIYKEDVRDIFECWMNDPDVSRYMWWKASDDMAEAERFVEYELGQTENSRWNRWLVFRKDTTELIGTCLVYWNDEDSEGHWDISYNLGKRFWGCGYATEAMGEVLMYARKELGMKECVTSYAKTNSPSARVLHKLGFVDEEDIPYECSGGEFVTDGIRCRLRTDTHSFEEKRI